MPQTVEVRFKGTRRDFFHWPDDQEPLRLREAVVVQAERGQDMGHVQTTGPEAKKKCGACDSCGVGQGVAEQRSGGRVVEEDRGDSAPQPVEAETAPAPEAGNGHGNGNGQPAPRTNGADTTRLPRILRRATPEDLRQFSELRKQEDELRQQVIAKVRQHGLEMRVSDTEWQWDRSKLTIYFTAEKRVDFRALVRELASAFRTRIELRQIGVRDEAARLGGVGRCGREFCCSTWLKELNPVSLTLAKDQHLSLNPAQISGGCGRLLCCLKYEHEFYVAARKRFPREGKTLQTRHGAEKVVAVDIFRERVFLRSEAHGPRIIPLVQLREEQAEREAGAEPIAAPSVPTRSGPERRPGALDPRRPERPQAGERPGDRPGDRGNRPGSRGGDRPADRAADRGATARPADQRPSGKKPAPPPPPRAPENSARRDQGAPSPSRRRRRGRRGRGGPDAAGPGAPPSAPEA